MHEEDNHSENMIIHGDNLSALKSLLPQYEGRIKCIYIDPPYNTGAKDWKYNNDYVDGADEYRHSKWLSFIQKRLNIAKKLLNPQNSFLVVTIDEKEYLYPLLDLVAVSIASDIVPITDENRILAYHGLPKEAEV